MIQVSKLTVKFDGKIVLNNLNCEIKEGEITALVGESGCGKTTFLRCIAGLQKYKGNIVYGGNIIKGRNDDIFMMHQHYCNFPWKTCLQNILFPISIKRKVTEEDIQEACKILDNVGLLEYKDKFPSELSGGMNQRLALARVFIAKPKVILMDEPMSALDTMTKQKMELQLLSLHNKTKNTIIMITHDENQAKKLAKNNIINFNHLKNN